MQIKFRSVPAAWRTKTLALALAGSAMAGCSVLPVPITEEAVKDRVQADQLRIYSNQEEIAGPVTFKEALARSLKYNLDHRLKLMETALNQGLAKVANYDMLPNLLVSAGYTQRNNITGSRSFQIVNDQIVEPATPSYTGGQEKQRNLASAEFSWSVLDFGVGYYRAKQQADQVLIAEERRRRVVQNILQDVRSAYWRAVGAQRLADDAGKLMERVRSALERSRKAESLGLLSPKEALGYQRMLLDAVNLLSARRQELDLAKRELAALMNVTPGTAFTLAEEAEPPLPPMPANTQELEELALLNRPELRQEDYQARITASEAKKQLFYLLPNLSITAGPQYDSNKYLYNNHWFDAGTRVTWNLFRALSLPDMQAAQNLQVKTDDMRRMALSMAVLTQVRVALERYRMSLDEFEVAKESLEVDRRLTDYARAAVTARVDSELEYIRAETRAINSAYQRHTAYAAAQNAFGRIYNSVGLEVVPGDLEDASLAEIGNRVSAHIAQIENETFARLIAKTDRLQPLVVVVEDGRIAKPGVRQAATLGTGSRKTVADAMRRALGNNRLLLSDDDKACRLTARLLVQPPVEGIRRAEWQLTLSSADGSLLGQVSHASTLAEDFNDSSLVAFAEAAAVANLDKLRQWLGDGAEQQR